MKQEQLSRINEAYSAWQKLSFWDGNPFHPFKIGYLMAIEVEPYPYDRVPMPQNRKQAEGMILIAENYLKHNKDK